MSMALRWPVRGSMAWAVMVWALAGCSLAPASDDGASSRKSLVQSGQGASVQMPLLQLAPGALGYALSEQQVLLVTGPDGIQRQLQALLEVDAQHVRLALTHWGQVLASLVWDGQSLQVHKGRHLPEQVLPERVLSDLQLALWPAQAVRQALPQGWTLRVASDGTRVLLHQQVVHITVQLTAMNVVEMEYVEAGWKLQVMGASVQGLQALREGGQP